MIQYRNKASGRVITRSQPDVRLDASKRWERMESLSPKPEPSQAPEPPEPQAPEPSEPVGPPKKQDDDDAPASDGKE